MSCNKPAQVYKQKSLNQFILTCGFIYHVNESLTISQKYNKLTSGNQVSQRIGSIAQYQQILKSLKDQMSFLVPWDCLKNHLIPKITEDVLNIDLLWAK